MRKFLLSTAVASLLAVSGAAQEWQSQEHVDPFTDEAIVGYYLSGEVLDHPNQRTTLVHRQDGDDVDFFWVTPLAFICDATDPDVTLRFGQEDPEEANFSVSTDNEAIFFTSPAYIADKMRQHGSMLVRLTDHCGNRTTASFKGDVTQHVSNYDVFKDSNWEPASGGGIKYVTPDYMLYVVGLGMESAGAHRKPTLAFGISTDIYTPSGYLKKFYFDFAGTDATGAFMDGDLYGTMTGYHPSFVSGLTLTEFQAALTTENPVLTAYLDDREVQINLKELTPEMLELLQ
jgi:hypothetical protein